MNNVYIYDGNFLNLLNLIMYLFKNKVVPGNIKMEGYLGCLFDYIITLKITNTYSLDNFNQKFGDYNMHIMYYVFLSNDKNKELIIYYYLLNYFKYGNNLSKMRNLNCVDRALKISKYVGNEAHKLKGFIRFKELKNHLLYASVAPENNVLEILSWHFKKRLKNEYWIIKDTKRKIISIYDKKDFYILKEEEWNLQELILDKSEELFADLWKTFYNTTGIKERLNERCRMNFMPKKYWQNMLEVSDEL